MDLSSARMTDVVIRNGGNFIQITSAVDIDLKGLEQPGIEVYYEHGNSSITIKVDSVLFNKDKVFQCLKNEIENMGYNVVALSNC